MFFILEKGTIFQSKQINKMFFDTERDFSHIRYRYERNDHDNA